MDLRCVEMKSNHFQDIDVRHVCVVEARRVDKDDSPSIYSELFGYGYLTRAGYQAIPNTKLSTTCHVDELYDYKA